MSTECTPQNEKNKILAVVSDMNNIYLYRDYFVDSSLRLVIVLNVSLKLLYDIHRVYINMNEVIFNEPSLYV
jgi:hypothetical protein